MKTLVYIMLNLLMFLIQNEAVTAETVTQVVDHVNEPPSGRRRYLWKRYYACILAQIVQYLPKYSNVFK